MKGAAGFLIAELAAIHLQEVAGGDQGLADAGEIGAEGGAGNREDGQGMRVGGMLAGCVELALQVLLGDLDVAHGHADIVVSQQLHESGKADTEAEHLRSESVAQAVRRDRAGAAGSISSIGKGREKSLVQSVMATGAGQKPARGVGQSCGRRGSTQSQDAGHDLSNGCVGRHPALGVQFADGDMQRPLVRTDLPQAVQRQIDTLADADSSGASEQQRMGRQVVSAAQFLLEKLIVLRRQRSGQIFWLRGKVLATNQAGLDGMSVGGQVLQQTAEVEQAMDTGFVAQRYASYEPSGG